MRFLAIDFETANSKRSSICSFGYALFENGQLAQYGAELCRPIPELFDPWNIKVHGIKPEMVQDLPGFEAHIEMITDLQPDFLVAHNASFDMSCIRHWCDMTDQKYPSFDYVCTLVSSRLLYPSFSSHTLDSISRVHGIALNHHDAGSDAVACGWIMQKSIDIVKAATLNEFCNNVGIKSGNITNDHYSPCVAIRGFPESCKREKRNIPERISDICCQADPDLSANNPLNGAYICFTGELNMSSRTEAAKLAAMRGAIPQDNVTMRTNFLVVGHSDLIDFENGRKTSKLKKAEQYIENDACLQIISEDEFVDFLVWDK